MEQQVPNKGDHIGPSGATGSEQRKPATRTGPSKQNPHGTSNEPQERNAKEAGTIEAESTNATQLAQKRITLVIMLAT